MAIISVLHASKEYMDPVQCVEILLTKYFLILTGSITFVDYKCIAVIRKMAARTWKGELKTYQAILIKAREKETVSLMLLSVVTGAILPIKEYVMLKRKELSILLIMKRLNVLPDLITANTVGIKALYKTFYHHNFCDSVPCPNECDPKKTMPHEDACRSSQKE